MKENKYTQQPLSCYNTSYIDERSELSLEDSSTVAKLYF